MISAIRTQAPSPSRAAGRASGDNTIIRDATPDDMAAIQALYAQHVLQGTATFEEIPPTIKEMQDRRAHIVALGLPYLLAEINGRLAGYCYASPYRPRSAYRYTLENSIYLAEDQTGRSEEHTSELQSLMRTSYAVF